MSRWLVVLGVVVLALIGVLFWQLADKPSEPDGNVAAGNQNPDTGAKDPPPTTPDARESEVGYIRPVSPQSSDKRDSGPEEDLIDPESETFNKMLDVVVGNNLRAAAAFECDESGIEPNAKIKLNYRVRIANGRVSITDVRVIESEVPKAYEECYVRNVSAATFRLERMPDYEEGDQELITRVRSMKKYRSRAEFDKD